MREVVSSGWMEELYGKRLKSLKEIFGVGKPIIGMVHLMPLPGSPGFGREQDQQGQHSEVPEVSDGAIVGTSLKEKEAAQKPGRRPRVKEYMKAVQAFRKNI